MILQLLHCQHNTPDILYPSVGIGIMSTILEYIQYRSKITAEDIPSPVGIVDYLIFSHQ